jgi:hypothetical protein
MKCSRINKALLTFGVLALMLSIGARQAKAQDVLDPSFSSFNEVTVTDVTKYLFTINGSTVNSANPVGTSGTYRFGFDASGDAIPIKFSDNTTAVITGVESVYLVHNGSQDGKDSITATLSISGAPITNYDGSGDSPNWTGGPAPGANFPSYAAANFGNADFLKGGSEYNGLDRYGDYSFTGITLLKNPSDPVFFGFHARLTLADDTVTTEFLRFGGDGGGGFPPVPEPVYYQLATLLGLGGLCILRFRSSPGS